MNTPASSPSVIIDKVIGLPNAELPEKVYKPYGSALELMYARDPEVLIEGPSGT